MKVFLLIEQDVVRDYDSVIGVYATNSTAEAEKYLYEEKASSRFKYYVEEWVVCT